MNPVVPVTGPRQVGKTAVLQKCRFSSAQVAESIMYIGIAGDICEYRSV